MYNIYTFIKYKTKQKRRKCIEKHIFRLGYLYATHSEERGFIDPARL